MPRLVCWPGILLFAGLAARGEEPQAIDPFGPRTHIRADAVPGYLELSNGAVHPGKLYLTRDARFKIFDTAQKRFRDVPLRVIRRIDCTVLRQWNEKEWRFKGNGSDEKVFTGRSYPAREYEHTITLRDGRTIRGPLSGILYVQKASATKAERYILHKRDKGPVGSTVKALVYVRSIHLGEKALKEGQRKTAKKQRGS
jgi:hypothetical protein